LKRSRGTGATSKVMPLLLLTALYFRESLSIVLPENRS
jgi:hypothetical protein